MAKLILVADDTKEILELYELILTEEGYEVSLHSIHTDVVKEAVRLNPALIILDLRFYEQLVGWEVVDELRTAAATASIPIIVSSAKTPSEEEIEKWLKGQDIAFLAKPFDITELVELVESLTGQP